MEAYYAEIQNGMTKNVHYLVGNTWDDIIADTFRIKMFNDSREELYELFPPSIPILVRFPNRKWEPTNYGCQRYQELKEQKENKIMQKNIANQIKDIINNDENMEAKWIRLHNYCYDDEYKIFENNEIDKARQYVNINDNEINYNTKYFIINDDRTLTQYSDEHAAYLDNVYSDDIQDSIANTLAKEFIKQSDLTSFLQNKIFEGK